MIAKENITSEEIQDNLMEFVSHSPAIPVNQISIIAQAFSNIISSSLGLGNTVIQGKFQRDIEIIKKAEEMYGTTLNSALKYLESRNLLKNEQKKICFQFYESFCTDMTAKQKIKFMILEHEQEIKKVIVFGAVCIAVASIVTIGVCYCTHTVQANETIRAFANSKHYQKTQRAAMKYASKKKM